MKNEQELISDFEKESIKLLKIIKDIQKFNDKIIIKCQDNMLSLCIDNEDDLGLAENISKSIDFSGYMETTG